jgi:ubiquinone/menaquinone biosynthesis C-methylase UbiE
MSIATVPTIDELNKELENFKDQRFASAQEADAMKELARFDGRNVESFRRGIELVDNLPLDRISLLDIGCGIGFYGLLFQKYSNKQIEYRGCDFSSAMVETARRLNPGAQFQQNDARELSHPDKSFDVVWISALLEHVPECEQVLAEAARVGRSFILLHRLFLHEGPTRRQILTTKANEYPFEGFSYPRLVRNAGEFDAAISRLGRIVRKQPWSFDSGNPNSLCLHSYTIQL